MRNLPKYIDIGFCLVVLPVMMLLFPMERWFHQFPAYMLSLGCWLYTIYFVNRLVTVPFLFVNGWKRWAGIGILLFSCGVTYVFSAIHLYTPPPNIFDHGFTKLFPTVKQYQQAAWTLFMIVEAFSFAVGLLIQTDLQRRRRMEVEAEREHAEISLCKAQIKPHFMFNTLNSLYGLFLTGDDMALPSLEKFIGMMRYMTASPAKEFVGLEEECEYIRQYVSLQALRLNERTKVSLDIDIEGHHLMIPPMLMITFVENCFKHGVSATEPGQILISITERGGLLTLSTCNRIFPARTASEHLGIENCRRRLSLVYPDRHDLTISDSGDFFNVKLQIRIQK